MKTQKKATNKQSEEKIHWKNAANTAMAFCCDPEFVDCSLAAVSENDKLAAVFGVSLLRGFPRCGIFHRWQFISLTNCAWEMV